MLQPESRDLTTARAARAEAERRTDALAHLARRMAHDLSNFLTVIRTYSELMLGDLPPEHPSRADLGEIAQAADLTVAYVQRASAFGRIEGSKQVAFVVDELVRDTLQAADAAALGPLRFALDCNGALRGPASALSEALRELVRNAREAAGPGATVEVRSRRVSLAEPVVRGGMPLAAGDWGVIEIVDRGPGFDLASADTLCDPFVTGKTGERGAGMGLAIARTAAWAAGGELVLERLDGATVAALHLPLSLPLPQAV